MPMQSRLFLFSANDEHSLRNLSSLYATHFGSLANITTEVYADKLAYTLSSRRSLLPWREAVVASSIADLAEKLASTYIAPVRANKPPRLGFVFSGQGSGWTRMGIELMEAFPIFKTSMLNADNHLKSLGSGWSLASKSESKCFKLLGGI